MGKELVLISHGDFCVALKKSTEMIMGPQKNIHTVSLLPEESADAFSRKFKQTIKNLTDFIVFADLMGGTPCNVVSKLILEGEPISLYAGMNMPMVVAFINNEYLHQSFCPVEVGSENIQHVNKLIAEINVAEESE